MFASPCHTLSSLLYLYHHRDNDPRITAKFVFAEDVASKESARKVIYSLFPGDDVYRVWIKSAHQLKASDEHMKHLAKMRERRVEVRPAVSLFYHMHHSFKCSLACRRRRT